MTEKLVAAFAGHGEPARAQQMARYMQNRFPFLGLPAPLRRELSRPFLSGQNRPTLEEIPHTVRALWSLEYREYQYVALDLMMRHATKAPESWLDLYEECIVRKSWWDTVDGLSASCVGPLLGRHGHLVGQRIPVWMDSGNMWLQRTCLLFQLKYKRKTDIALLERCIVDLRHSSEFFIQKAIGWSLRTYFRTDPHWVKLFVERVDLAPLSRREALRLAV